MDLLTGSRELLEKAGYSVSRAWRPDALLFEDTSIFGALWVAPMVSILVQSWHDTHEELLRKYAKSIRSAGEKSWNAYFVVLTDGPLSATERQTVKDIEEDFRSTRKIVAAGVLSLGDIEQALLPLLPIRNAVPETSINLQSRISDRLEDVPEAVVDALLGRAKPREFAEILIKANENR